MSQAVLNNSQAVGHTDLLSGILKVQVRNEEKITEQDRIYCQNQQDELYKTLDQIAWWYNIFKREAEKYEGKIKLKHEPNGKITTSSYDLHYRYNNDEKDYTHHEFTPFKNINDLVDSRHNAIRNFISRIIGYFNNTYSVSVEAPKIDEKTLPIDFRPASNWSKVKPELKKDKIIFPDIVTWDSFHYEYYKDYKFSYETDRKVSRFCEGIAFGADDVLCGSIEMIMGLDTRDVDISRWYDLTTTNAVSLKFYGNTRIDVKFKDSAAAESCFKRLRLNEIKLRDEN